MGQGAEEGGSETEASDGRREKDGHLRSRRKISKFCRQHLGEVREDGDQCIHGWQTEVLETMLNSKWAISGRTTCTQSSNKKHIKMLNFHLKGQRSGPHVLMWFPSSFLFGPAARVDPGFSWGGGGGTIMCTHPHYETETWSPFCQGSWVLEAVGFCYGLSCYLSLLSILIKNGIKENI